MLLFLTGVKKTMRKFLNQIHFTIKKYFVLYIGFLFACMLLMVIFTSLYAVHIIRKEAYHSIDIGMRTQVAQLNTNLHRTEIYLSGFVYNDADVADLGTANWNNLEWMKSIYHLQETFSSALKVQLADNFFYYSPDADLFVTSSNPVSASLRKRIRAASDSGLYFNKRNAGKWNVIYSDNKYYLIRVLKLRNGYIGAYLSINSAIRTFSLDSEDLYIDFALSNGTLLSTSPVTPKIDNYRKISESENDVIKINGQPELFMSYPITKSSSVKLIALVPDRSVSSSISIFETVAVIMIFLCMILLFLSFWFGDRIILRPISSMSATIIKIRSGQPDARIRPAFRCDEFIDMSNAFNEMMDEIRNLQISVYEEQLHKKQIEIEFLKLQLTPHFLVNCLNTVYELTEAGHPDLSMQMTRDLTKHLRYLLSCGTTVSFKEEAALTANYVELSSIRYPGSIRLTTDYDAAGNSIRVIPLLLLSFVENIIKHEIEIGKVTDICIYSKVNADHTFYIDIYDTGLGYSDEMLGKLQNMEHYIQENDEHIGIGNVYSRARLILGEQCTFRFANRKDAGAEVEITIPVP